MATLNINIASASETVEGLIEIATQAETDTGTDDLKALTPLKLEASTLVQTTVAANTAKVTNATHTGEVTGSGALTVDKTAISNKTLVTALAGDHVLIGDASDSDNLKKVNVSDFLGGGGNPISDQIFFNVSNNALADSQTYYLGQTTIYAAGATSLCHIPLPAGLLTAVEIVTWTTNTIGTEEATLTLVHAGGSVVLSTTLKFNARNVFIQTGFSEVITAGGAYLTLVTPNYATNPGNSQVRTHLKIEV